MAENPFEQFKKKEPEKKKASPEPRKEQPKQKENPFKKFVPPPPEPSTWAGWGKSALTGIAQGLADIPGTFGTAGQMTEDATSAAAQWVGVPEDYAGYAGKAVRWMGGPLMQGPTGEQIIGTVEDYTGPMYQPQTDSEKYINSATRFGASSVAGPGSWPMRVTSGVTAGLGSEFGGQQFEGSPMEPVARIGGALVGGMAPEGIRAGLTALAQALRSSDDKAAQIILQRLQESGLTPDEALQRVREMGPDAMLADVSPGMQVATGGTAIADPGAGQLIGSRLAARREAAPQRVNGGILDDAFGPYKGPQDLADDIFDARQPAGPAYELAKTHVVDPEPALAKIDDILKTFGPKSDIGRTLQGFKEQLIDDAGNVIGQGNIVHGIREQLDDAIDAAILGNQGKKAGRLQEVRNAIDEALKTQIPGFAEADNIWSSTAKLERAYEYGQQKLLGKDVYPDQSARTFERMTDPEFEATKQGVRAKLAMDFSNPAKNPAIPAERTLLGNMNDQKVPQLIGADKAERLKKGLGNEVTFLETSALGEPTRGSRTAVIGAAADMYGATGMRSLLGDTTAGAMAGGLLGGPAGIAAGAGAGFVTNAQGRVAEALRTKAKPAVVQAAADLLTRSGGNVQAAIDMLNNAAQSMPSGSVKEGAIRALANALLSLKSSVPATAESR
jgi:hypothetical protein